MIQSQEIQFWDFMDGSNLVQAATLVDPIHHNTRMKPLSCPSQFILRHQRAVKNDFQEKELFYNCSTLVFVRLFVVAAATVYQEPPFWRTEGLELLHLCVTKISVDLT